MGCPAPVQALYSVLLKVKGKLHRCWLTVTQLPGSAPALAITAASRVTKVCSCILLHFAALFAVCCCIHGPECGAPLRPCLHSSVSTPCIFSTQHFSKSRQ